MIIGSDLADYDGIASALGPSCQFRGIRYYAGGGGNNVNIFPTPWPMYGPGTRVLMSVYPDLRELFSGRLDGRIRDMIADAPPGSMLNAWHEALSQLPDRPRYLTPANVYRMHRKMHALCRGSNVMYGCLLGGGDLRRLMRYVPPNLGFYGLDLYGNLGFRKTPPWQHPFHRWVQFRDLARAKDTAHHYPRLVIGETNCPDRSRRPAWFKLIASWLHGYGRHGTALLTFWSDNAHLGGPWDPTDKKTIDTLKSICHHYGR